ncbi:hypothetical protein Glove_410g83 [Diversispora epigaea]|uniref:Uncharacterized protein n=1 Tax=Diversispora epigaea TaxID=1348612 RepID=A0A397GYV0_9GLOM|nr:hypothetical protein Glove_410g83 [Diversispora epigaea]
MSLKEDYRENFVEDVRIDALNVAARFSYIEGNDLEQSMDMLSIIHSIGIEPISIPYLPS